MIKRLLWYIKADIILKTDSYWYNGKNYIDGFYFYVKRPFSKSYQWHAVIGLENTYNILKLIQESIREKKKALILDIQSGLGYERIVIWKGSFKKAENELFKM